MDMLVNRCRRRANLTEELVDEVVMRDHREAMRACDVEDLVSECIELASLLRRGWSSALDYLYSDIPGNIDDLYPIMLGTVKRATRTVQRASRLAEKYARKGYTIVGAAELTGSLAELERVVVEIQTKWPVNDPVVVAESLAAYHRGDYTSAEDLLRGAKGLGSDAD